MKLAIVLTLVLSTSAFANGVGPTTTDCPMMRGDKRSNPKAGMNFQDLKPKPTTRTSSGTGQ